MSLVCECARLHRNKNEKKSEKKKEMSTASSTNSAGSMSSSAVVHSSLASLVASNETDKGAASQGPSPHRRYHFSPMQTMELNNAFSQNPYPSVKYRQELATRLGIDQKVRMCSSCRYFFSMDSLSRH